MKPLTNITIQATKTLGIAAIAVLLLFLSSSNHFSEECSQETETVEIELLLSCRKEQSAAKTDSSLDLPAFQSCPVNCLPLSNLVVNSTSERDKMNGIGAYLIV